LSTLPTIYLLPGLGTDHRLFARLDLDGLPVHVLEWPLYGRGCTLPGLAREMATGIDAGRPHILVGVSMGGMVAQEIAALTRPERVVLVSSWTGPHEWPRRVRLAARLQLHHLITDLSMRATWPLKRRLLGGKDDAVDRLLYDMAVAQTARRIRIGTGALLRWKGSPWQGPLVRIHGDADRIIPLRFPVDHLVRGAGHVMMLTHGSEVGLLLRRVLG